jgi:hypothetical protein
MKHAPFHVVVDGQVHELNSTSSTALRFALEHYDKGSDVRIEIQPGLSPMAQETRIRLKEDFAYFVAQRKLYPQ